MNNETPASATDHGALCDVHDTENNRAICYALPGDPRYPADACAVCGVPAPPAKPPASATSDGARQSDAREAAMRAALQHVAMHRHRPLKRDEDFLAGVAWLRARILAAAPCAQCNCSDDHPWHEPATTGYHHYLRPDWLAAILGEDNTDAEAGT